eukprot:gene7658-biopygen29
MRTGNGPPTASQRLSRCTLSPILSVRLAEREFASQPGGGAWTPPRPPTLTRSGRTIRSGGPARSDHTSLPVQRQRKQCTAVLVHSTRTRGGTHSQSAWMGACDPLLWSVTCPWEKWQRTRTGRGPHDRVQRNGRGPDAGGAVSPLTGADAAPPNPT